MCFRKFNHVGTKTPIWVNMDYVKTIEPMASREGCTIRLVGDEGGIRVVQSVHDILNNLNGGMYDDKHDD